VACLHPKEKTKVDFTVREKEDIEKITDINKNLIEQLIKIFSFQNGLQCWIREKKAKWEITPSIQKEFDDLLNYKMPEYSTKIAEKGLKHIQSLLGYTDKFIEKKEQRKNTQLYKKFKRTKSCQCINILNFI